jgi:hypothetical protein
MPSYLLIPAANLATIKGIVYNLWSLSSDAFFMLKIATIAIVIGFPPILGDQIQVYDK